MLHKQISLKLINNKFGIYRNIIFKFQKSYFSQENTNKSDLTYSNFNSKENAVKYYKPEKTLKFHNGLCTLIDTKLILKVFKSIKLFSLVSQSGLLVFSIFYLSKLNMILFYFAYLILLTPLYRMIIFARKKCIVGFSLYEDGKHVELKTTKKSFKVAINEIKVEESPDNNGKSWIFNISRKEEGVIPNYILLLFTKNDLKNKKLIKAIMENSYIDLSSNEEHSE